MENRRVNMEEEFELIDQLRSMDMSMLLPKNQDVLKISLQKAEQAIASDGKGDLIGARLFYEGAIMTIEYVMDDGDKDANNTKMKVYKMKKRGREHEFFARMFTIQQRWQDRLDWIIEYLRNPEMYTKGETLGRSASVDSSRRRDKNIRPPLGRERIPSGLIRRKTVKNLKGSDLNTAMLTPVAVDWQNDALLLPTYPPMKQDLRALWTVKVLERSMRMGGLITSKLLVPLSVWSDPAIQSIPHLTSKLEVNGKIYTIFSRLIRECSGFIVSLNEGGGTRSEMSRSGSCTKVVFEPWPKGIQTDSVSESWPDCVNSILPPNIDSDGNIDLLVKNLQSAIKDLEEIRDDQMKDWKDDNLMSELGQIFRTAVTGQKKNDEYRSSTLHVLQSCLFLDPWLRIIDSYISGIGKCDSIVDMKIQKNRVGECKMLIGKICEFMLSSFLQCIWTDLTTILLPSFLKRSPLLLRE